MKSIVQIAALLSSTIFMAADAGAEIIITLSQNGTGVTASWSGMGTVSTVGSNPGTVIDFRNFSGNPFSASADLDRGLTPGLVIDGLDGVDSYVNLFETVEFSGGGGTGTADLIFRGIGITAIEDGFTFEASTTPTATVSGLLFSDLNVGTYSASLTSGDAADFGGVTLNIVTAIPEPSTFAGVGLLMGIGFGVRRRRAA